MTNGSKLKNTAPTKKPAPRMEMRKSGVPKEQEMIQAVVSHTIARMENKLEPVEGDVTPSNAEIASKENAHLTP